MKTPHVIGLLTTHAALVLLGFWLAGHAPSDKPGITFDAKPRLPENSVGKGRDPNSPNPILRASGADFRAAWDEMILGKRSSSGEPHWNSINFFIDWCAVDPEGAVKGLSRLYAPRFAHNYLSNSIGSYGAEMAPALAKHWRELRYMPDHKVEWALGSSFAALAAKDPEGAAALTNGLPSRMRSGIYRNLFSKLELDALRRTVDGLTASRDGGKEEITALWDAVADAVDVADAKRGVWDWLVRAESPEARRALAEEGMIKSARSENWGTFFDTMALLDAGAQAEVREQLRKRLASQQGNAKSAKAIAEECQRRGMEDWTAGMSP